MYNRKQAGVAVVITLVLFLTSSRSAERPAAVQANRSGSGAGRIFIQDASRIAVSYVGPQSTVDLLDSGQARPLSLTRSDFNQDGIEDLVAGYAAPDGRGILVLHTGNLDAFAPQSYESWLAIGQSRFPSPFLNTAKAFAIPLAPDFLVTGNFTGGDHTDLIAAARGGSALYFLAGDGQGGFAAPESVPLPGPITALAAGRFGATVEPSTVLVGLGGEQPALVAYSCSGNGLSLTARYSLTAPATSIAFDDLDGDGLPDALILAGGQISILHAAGSSGKPELEPVTLPLSPVAAMTGFFVHDRGGRRQIAALYQNGNVAVVAHGGFDPKGWTKDETKAMRDALMHHRPNPFRRAQSGPIRDGWQVIETLPGMALPGGGGRTPILMSSRISGQGTDDVLVIDSQGGQMAVATHPQVHGGATALTPARVLSRAYIGGTPVAALSFRVNVDAREGLVVLHEGQAAPLAIMPIPDPTGASSTIIQADASLADQVFFISRLEENQIKGFPVAMSNFTITGGQTNSAVLGATSGGALFWDAGTDGMGTLTLTNVTISGNSAVDAANPGLDDGGGITLFTAKSSQPNKNRATVSKLAPLIALLG